MSELHAPDARLVRARAGWAWVVVSGAIVLACVALASLQAFRLACSPEPASLHRVIQPGWLKMPAVTERRLAKLEQPEDQP